MLNVLTDLPNNLLKLEPKQLHTVLTGPTLIHLQGRRERPLFVSVLLHGNEDTSWLALRELLLQYKNRELPRALSIFIGNVQAARYGLRKLAGQPDYNRIWKETNTTTPENAMTDQVLEEMKQKDVFAAIDIHNNTGLNPHYGCVNVLEPAFLHLACMFNRTVVWFTRPDEVLSMAFAKLCPAVTVECGKTRSRIRGKTCSSVLRRLSESCRAPKSSSSKTRLGFVSYCGNSKSSQRY